DDGIRVRNVTGVQTCALPILDIVVLSCICLHASSSKPTYPSLKLILALYLRVVCHECYRHCFFSDTASSDKLACCQQITLYTDRRENVESSLNDFDTWCNRVMQIVP